jgi:positive regulator of sigma E activity
MKEFGIVQEIEGSTALVRCEANDGCKACGSADSCTVEGKEFNVTFGSEYQLAPGDTVEIFLPPGRTMMAGFMVLIFPLITFIGGFILVDAIAPEASEGVKSVAGLAGLGLGFLTSWVYSRIGKEKYVPRVTRKLS